MDITTASPQERKRLYDRIAREMKDDRFFTSKELALLPKIMKPDEWLYGYSSGYMDNSTWLIVLTSKRVIFLNKNFLFGHEETSIGLGKINSVQKKTGIMFGEIMLHDGSREYAIRNVWKKTVIPFTNRLERAMEDFERAARMGVPIPPPEYSSGDIEVEEEDVAPVDEMTQEAPLVEWQEPDRTIELPPPPVSGPLRAYLDSVPDVQSPSEVSNRRPAPMQSNSLPPASLPHANADTDGQRQRLDRLLNAGAISKDEYTRQMRELGR